MNKKKICFIGHFGQRNNAFDGQTIRTLLFYDELNKSGEFKISIIDTTTASKHKIRFVFSLFFKCLVNKRVIIMLSDVGRNQLFKFFKYFRCFKRNIIYNNVIGGNFHETIPSQYIKVVKSFNINWVQTKKLMDEMQKIGVTNCGILPNFRSNDIADDDVSFDCSNGIFDFCMFSRLSEDKGITSAISSIAELNSKASKEYIHLHLFGKIENRYKELFFKLLKENNSFVHYYGPIDSSKASSTLSKFYCLLFPTYWKGEGFPGTILDAFFAGIPVIASDWNCNSELIENGYNGFVYPNESMSNLTEAIMFSIENKNLFLKMRKNCRETAKLFKSEKHMPKVIDYICNNLKYGDWNENN